tara:strand:+ start:5007 stop:5213 length:207 start_codon:yes stop_codon:yes gene_type:complete
MSELEDKIKKSIEEAEEVLSKHESFVEDFEERMDNAHPDSILGLMKSMKQNADNITNILNQKGETNDS